MELSPFTSVSFWRSNWNWQFYNATQRARHKQNQNQNNKQCLR